MRVLIVSDDPDIAHLLAMMQRDAGHDAVAVGTLSAARSRFGSAWAPDVVVLDWSMQDGEALDFCREAEAAWPGVRIVNLRSM